MYRLDNRFARDPFTGTVVGCGGTGGFVAEGLCRLLPPQATLVLVDPDRVEKQNLMRQNFTQEELGCLKAEALAHRLARRYGRPVAYSILPVAMAGVREPGLVIGCVDNGPARADIAKRISRDPLWWVDAGNGENYGQVLIGNAPLRGLARAFDPDKDICHALPLPTLQRSELLAQRPPAPDCAGAVVTGEQGPAINQAMAALVVEVAHRLIGPDESGCPWMQLYLDLEVGTLYPVLATPEMVGRVTGMSQRKLMRTSRETLSRAS